MTQIPRDVINVRKCTPKSRSQWATLTFHGETLGVVQSCVGFPYFRLLTNWDERWVDWRTRTDLGSRTLDGAVSDALGWISDVSQRVAA